MKTIQVALLALLSLFSSTSYAQNTWIVSESEDPMTDQIIRTAKQSVIPVTSTNSKEVSLVLRCVLTEKSRGGYKGKLEIYFHWDEVINVEHFGSLTYISVQTRFDDDKMSGNNWSPSNDFQSSFVRDIHNVFNRSGEQKGFLKKMLKADKLIARVTAAFDNNITATFDLSNFKQEAASVLEYCD